MAIQSKLLKRLKSFIEIWMVRCISKKKYKIYLDMDTEKETPASEIALSRVCFFSFLLGR